MTKPKLTYFDAPMSRGEECRLALHVAGVDFEDNRIKRDEWMAMKPTTPFGSLPLFEMPGQPVLAQSTAILTFIGRKWGLHPEDLFEAARHEAMMASVEELRATVGPTLRMTDEAEKKTAREGLVATFFPTWGKNAENQIGSGPFFGGSTIHVVDFKLHMIVRWFLGGKVDHVPANVFASFPKLMRVHDAVKDHPRVKEWTARY